MPSAEVGGELGLEGLDLRTEDEALGVDHLGELGLDLLAQRGDGRTSVKKGDWHGRRWGGRDTLVGASSGGRGTAARWPYFDPSREALYAQIIAACVVVGAALWPQPARQPPTSCHPGVQTNTNGGCTANFVFFDASNNVYIGQAAHCRGRQHGHQRREAGSLPHGTPVEVGGDQPGHDRLLVVGDDAGGG